MKVSDKLDLHAAQQEAARVAARTQIRDIRLLRAATELMRFPGEAVRLRWSLETDVEVERDETDGDSFVLKSKYSVKVVEVPAGPAVEEEQAQADEDDGETITSISFEFAALFSIALREGDESATDEELRAYSLTTGAFAMYPYAREYIYDTTGRLGLPPLTVGVLTLPVKRS